MIWKVNWVYTRKYWLCIPVWRYKLNFNFCIFIEIVIHEYVYIYRYLKWNYKVSTLDFMKLKSMIIKKFSIHHFHSSVYLVLKQQMNTQYLLYLMTNCSTYHITCRFSKLFNFRCFMLPVNSVDTANMVLILSLSAEIPPMHLKAKYYIEFYR